MPLRILLADDSMTAQNMGKKILTDAGFDVVTVSNGAAAIKKLVEAAPDIAILDVYMPGYTGLEVCERMKAHPGMARIPVLLSVGKMEPFRPEDGMKVKADGVIIKPFEATDLVTVVQKLADRSFGPPAPAAEPEPAVAPVPEGQAEGLQTFAPVDSVAEIPAEPSVEFTAQAPAVVESAPLNELMPTVLQADSVPEIPQPPLAALETASETAQVVAPSFAAAASAAAAVAPAMETHTQPAPFKDFEEDPFAVPEEPVAPATSMEVAEKLVAVDEPALPAEMLPPDFGMDDSDSMPVSQPVPVEQQDIGQAVAPADWTAVEADIPDELDLDLEAEMQNAAGAASNSLDSVARESHPDVRPETAVPLVAPFGRTSYDELEELIEKTAAQSETSDSVAPEQTVSALEESPLPKDAEELELADELAGNAFDLGPGEAIEAAPFDVAAKPVQAVTPVLEEEVFPTEDPLAPPENAVVPENQPAQAESSDELLEVGREEEIPSQPAAEAPSQALSALAFYGLDDLPDEEEPLSNPVEQPDDEPLFSITDEVTLPETANVVDEPLLSDEAPIASAPEVMGESVLEEALAPEPGVEPIEEIVAQGISPEALAAEATLLTQEEIAQMQADAPVTPVAQVSVTPAPGVVTEEIIGGMVGRVVDRVVDRLKPILTVMVEEILAEVKKK